MHPHEEHGERFWEEVRLLERITDDVKERPEKEQVRTINHFLNEQCEVLSVGHAKCQELLDGEPVLPVYETVKDYEKDEPHVVGCYGCNEMYRADSDPMPEAFEELREQGIIRVGGLDYSRKVSVN
ncbi:MAG: hypothetical protein ACLFTA_00270 [Candidatus Nanohaloarchaea archaeon]